MTAPLAAASARSRTAAAVLPVLIFALCVLRGSNAASAAAAVTLRAKWSGSPFLQEAAELLADDDAAKFWTFVEASFTASPPKDATACWAHVLDLATPALNAGWAKMAPLLLASRKYSAKLAPFQQAMEEEHADVQSCCFASVNGMVASSPAELANVIKHAATGPGLQLLPSDHIYPVDDVKPSALSAVLYAPVGAACAAPLHQALKQAATTGDLVYAFRPTLSKACTAKEGSCVQFGGGDEAMTLPGWGVEATVKPDDAAGTRKEVSSLKDLGLQATQRVLKAKDPLAKLVDVAQNLPSHIPALTKQEVNSTLRQAVQHNQQYLSPGTNFMLLNGLAVNIEDLDYYGLLDRLQSETKVVEQLSAVGLSRPDASQALRLRAEDASDKLEEQTRLDLGSHPGGDHDDEVLWLNDLTTDSNWAKFSRRISDLVNGNPPGRLRPMGLNLCNLVAVVDPTHSDGLIWATTYHTLWQDATACRFGLLPKVPAAVDRLKQKRTDPSQVPADLPWAQKTMAEKVALGMYTFEKAFGEYYGMIFWIALATRITNEHSWGEDAEQTLQRQFQDQWQAASMENPRSRNADNARRTDSAVAWQQLMEGKGWSIEAGKRLRTVTAYMDKKGLADFSTPVATVNGKLVVFPTAIDQPQLQPQLFQKLMDEQARLREAVYFGRLTDNDNVELRMLQIAGSVKRWNPSIMASAGNEYVPLNALVQDPAYHAQVPRFVRGTVASFKGDEQPMQLHPVTHLAVCNLGNRLGRRLAAEALRFLVDRLPNSPSARVLLLLNPSELDSALGDAPPTLLEAAVHLAFKQTPQLSGTSEHADTVQVTSQAVMEFVARLLGNETLAARLAEPLAADSLDDDEARGPLLELAKKAKLDVASLTKGLDALMEADEEDKDLARASRYKPTKSMFAMRMAHARMARSALDLPEGTSALITNGRVAAAYPASLQPSAKGVQVLVAEDLDLLTSIATQFQPAKALASLVQEAFEAGRVQLTNLPSDPLVPTEEVAARLEDVVAAASAIMSASGKVEEGPEPSRQLNQVVGFLKGSIAQVDPPASEAAGPSGLSITCVVDPLTRVAQRISQVLSSLRASPLAPTIQLVLNPQQVVADVPLTALYRYALPEISASSDSAPAPPSATFRGLTSQQVLSLRADVPDAWVVQPASARYDLEALRLADAPEAVAQVELELSALTLTGTCTDVSGSAKDAMAARGLQLQLGTPSQLLMTDTTVVAGSSSGLTYFQLQARPGRWLVSLAKGASRDGYKMLTVATLPLGPSVNASSAAATDTEMAVSARSVQVTMSSLRGKNVALKVRRRGGNKAGKLEIEDSAAKVQAAGSKDAVQAIHVFSVAAGHAEERRQRAMMASAVQSTKSAPLKFWLVADLASTHHKQVVAAMAKSLGFEHEYVSYKWPAWLPKPLDRQQALRAHKVMLLDLLLPASGLERVVLLDADSVVRSDLGDLARTDLKDKVYGFVPHCDGAAANAEMDVYMFWKHNTAWVRQLQGKPMFQSSPAVVDLPRFRATAAGDKLRTLFEQQGGNDNFTAAPLDESLPTWAQHLVGVQALPQEWAWCPTWCGAAGKAQAKTVVACANPKSQVTRVDAAQRIATEWPEFDRAQADVEQAVDAELGVAPASAATSSSRASKKTTMKQAAVEGDGPMSPPEQAQDAMQLPDVLSEAVPTRASSKDEL